MKKKLIFTLCAFAAAAMLGTAAFADQTDSSGSQSGGGDVIISSGDEAITESTKLTANKTVTGNLYLSGQLDLNGYNLTVKGDLLHTGGKLSVKDGTLTVGGDYVAAARTEDAYGNYSYSYAGGRLSMESTADTVNIGGSFVTYCNGYGHIFKNGTLTIGGDIIAYDGGDIKVSVSSGYAHKTIFKGKKILNYSDIEMYFGYLSVTEPTITVKGSLGAQYIESDFNVKSDGWKINGVFRLNGHKINAEGDVTVDTGVSLGGGTLAVDGSLFNEAYPIEIEKGTLDITGDYVAAKKSADTYTSAAGRIYMRDSEDTVNIGGSFITYSNGYSHTFNKGTLTIGGDIIAYDGGDINVTDSDVFDHKLIFKGKNIINYSDSNMYFGYMSVTEPTITVNGKFGAHHFESSFTVKSDGMTVTGDFGVDGNDITVDGDVTFAAKAKLGGGTLTVKGDLFHKSSSIEVENGTLNITGDYIAAEKDGDTYKSAGGFIKMADDNDAVNIGGDFITYCNGYSHKFNKGTLTIGGDMLIFDPADFSTGKNGEHTTVFKGSKIQNLSTGTEACTFDNLEIKSPSVTVSGKIGVTKLISGAKLVSDGMILCGFNCGGNSVAVTGDVSVISGHLTIAGGELKVTGDLIFGKKTDEGYDPVSGTLNMSEESDKLTVEGSFITNVSGYSHTLKNGVFTVKGDIIDYNGNIKVYSGSCDILTVFDGEKITNERNTTGFTRFKSAADKFTAKGSIGFGTLESDVTVVSDGLELADTDLNGHSLTIIGDVKFAGNITLNGGTLTVNGNVTHYSYKLTVDSGTLKITGNYDSRKTSSGRIVMDNDKGTVSVDGDFDTLINGNSHTLTAGTLIVKGNITDDSGDICASSGTHKTILAGDGPQSVTFSSKQSTFNILQLTKPLSNYTFSPDKCWKELILAELEKYTVTFSDAKVSARGSGLSSAEKALSSGDKVDNGTLLTITAAEKEGHTAEVSVNGSVLSGSTYVVNGADVKITVSYTAKPVINGLLINKDNFPDGVFRAYVSDNFDKDGDGALSDIEIDAAEEMTVSTDNISSLKGIEYFKALTSLKCSGSLSAKGKLTSLDVSGNTGLKVLDCTNNQLSSLDVSKNTALTELYCSYNPFAELNVSNNTELKYLYCYSDKLEKLDLGLNLCEKLTDLWTNDEGLTIYGVPDTYPEEYANKYDIPFVPNTAPAGEQVVYRLYNPVIREHLFTTDANEVRELSSKHGWNYEGKAWSSPSKGTPVYRLYSLITFAHLYTTDENERDALLATGAWTIDNGGEALFYSAKGENGIKIYRLYNEVLMRHLLTTDMNEYDTLAANGWNGEGFKFSCTATGDPAYPIPQE